MDTAYSNDLLIQVDSDDNIIDYKTKADCHKGDGLLHRAFSIFIFNADKQLLIQQRSAGKMLWPLHWSNSVCSHPRKNESYQQGIKRRLMEEIGIETPLKFLFKFQYQSGYENIGSENELCSVYIGQYGGQITADPLEIAEWKFIDISTLNQQLKNNPEHYTPWFKIEWQRMLAHYNHELDDLN